MAPSAPPPIQWNRSGWYRHWGWRAASTLWAGLVCFAVACVCTYMIASSGDMIEPVFDAHGGRTRAAVSLEPGCTANIIDHLHLHVQRAAAVGASRRRRGILSGGRGLALRCVKTRCCCRTARPDLAPILRDITRALLDRQSDWLEAASAERYAVAARALSRFEYVLTARFRRHLRSGERLVLDELLSEALLAMVTCPGVGTELATELVATLPSVAQQLLGGKIRHIVAAVWARLSADFFGGGGAGGATRGEGKGGAGGGGAGGGGGAAAIQPLPREAGAPSCRLSRVLSALLLDIVDFDALAAFKLWWLRAVVLYSTFLVMLAGLCVLLVSAATAYDVGDLTWFTGGTAALAVVLAAEVSGTFAFLRRRAELLTRSVCGSFERALLHLDTRDELQSLMADMLTVAIDEAAKQLWPLDGPLRMLYRHHGGHDAVLAAAAARYDTIAKPQIREAFADVLAESDEPRHLCCRTDGRGRKQRRRGGTTSQDATSPRAVAPARENESFEWLAPVGSYLTESIERGAVAPLQAAWRGYRVRSTLRSAGGGGAVTQSALQQQEAKEQEEEQPSDHNVPPAPPNSLPAPTILPPPTYPQPAIRAEVGGGQRQSRLRAASLAAMALTDIVRI